MTEIRLDLTNHEYTAQLNIVEIIFFKTVEVTGVKFLKHTKQLTLVFFSLLITACYYPPLSDDVDVSSDYTYIIGPGDTVQIYVWGNPDVTTTITIRPDGKLTVPLVEDVQAMGKTPYELARKMEEEYGEFIRDPQVVVIVSGFQGVDQQQVRIIGQIGSSGGNAGFGRYSGESIPYERDMTLLDVIIKVGTIGNFAAGNRASIIRKIDGVPQQFGVKIDNLMDDGNMAENVRILPGDILVIPEAFF